MGERSSRKMKSKYLHVLSRAAYLHEKEKRFKKLKSKNDKTVSTIGVHKHTKTLKAPYYGVLYDNVSLAC